jgi:hypothetical protein
VSTKTTQQASHTIATTLRDMLEVAEQLARAHDALTLPDSDDHTAVDWHAVVAQINALGDATHQLAQLANETMLPILRGVKSHALTALAEITALNQLTEARPRA